MLIPLRSQRSSRRNPSYPLPCAMQGPVWLAHGDSENGAEGSTWEQAKGVVLAVLTLAVGARKHPLQFIRRRTDAGTRGTYEGRFDLGPALSGAPKLNENANLHRPLIGRREQRRDARLVVKRESRRAASIPRHFGKNRSRAKRQPVAGNFHARTEATRPRLPFFQKLLPLLRQTLRFESGRIWPEAYHHPAKLPNPASGQNYLTRSVYKTQGKLVR
jgi:hypothetical protein